MKVVRFQKQPSQALGYDLADGALSGAGDSHNEKYHSQGLKIGRAEFRALRGASPAIVRELEYTSCARGRLQDGPARGHFRQILDHSENGGKKSRTALFRVRDVCLHDGR